MSEVRFFMRPESLFALVRELATQYQMFISFRRYTPSGFPAGFRVVDVEDDLARLYIDGGYSKFFLSLSAKPEHEQDLKFPPNSVAEQILEFIGGRAGGKAVEQCVARPLAKATLVGRQYKTLRRRLDVACARGVVHAPTGTPYPGVYWERALAGLDFVFRADLDDAEFVYRPL